MSKNKNIYHEENKITPKDIKDLNALLGELSENAEPIDLVWIKKVTRSSIIFLARDRSAKGKLAGMATLTKVWKPTGLFGTTEDVVVSKIYASQGIATDLMDRLIKKAKKMKMKYVELTSHPSRVAAQGLYKKVGFEMRETNVYRYKINLKK